MEKEWKKQCKDGSYTVRTCGWSPPGDHPAGCGMKLHIKDGKLVKVEGDPEHPISQGRLCVRCLSLPEYVHHPDRIIYPMKRDPKDRGKDKWQRITWDEAWDLIVEKVNGFKKNYGAESIVVFGGTGREACLYYYPLGFAALGTPNVCYPQSGWSCYGPRCAITDYILGAGYPEIDFAGYFPDRYDHPGWKLPEYIMLWGKEPLKSNPDGFYGHSIIDMMKRGTKIISVDPRMSWLGSRSEYLLQLRPGTDTALALAMLNVIINEDLYDHEFVEKWCYGFEQLKERVQQYPPDKVAEITGVPAEKIIEVSRVFAKAKPASLGWGLAIDQNPNGVQLGHALLSIMAITGNIDVPGGITLGMPAALMGKWRVETRGELTEELWDKRIGAKEWPALSTALATTHPDETLDTLETDKPYKLRMGWFNSSNFITPTCSAAPDRWYKALLKLEFNVVQDLFMTPTAMGLADLFLPLSSFAEHDGVVLTHYGRNAIFLGGMNKALQVGECKSDVEMMIELGKRLNPSAWPWNNAEEFFDDQLKPELGINFDDLRHEGLYQPNYEYRKYEKGLLRYDGEPGFNTVTGKVELCSTLFEEWGEDPLPYYKEPPFSPVSTPELAKEYPLVLTTGARTFTSFHSEHRQVKSCRDITPDPIMEINPETAAKLGIKDGDWVVIENQFGKCKERAQLVPTMKPNVVHAAHGWWYPEKEAEAPSLFGVWESNINTLIPHKTIGKLGFGAPFKSILCKVYKAND
ncbi:molybdopterin-dependent oxidoreductase [Sporomusa acidovorans]|uniref:Acetylene hydratase n=1 Tax=Sporomusa acidovorans (strain ATCC 49682 / DSM 3132 / Mol) TaxID=1123286 RepID=A0ABZ3IYQ1_SPOA4|nr:molybdopterin-dependent oxidoreductase [Sporomusa acidovorans]OZC16334.1 acetylene hydratase [Sporomusa acidovorans DSM 3132]SDF73538.1 Anaerobic selenocysteine-containing dehydrogenase [Sporomusa acidovorans]